MHMLDGKKAIAVCEIWGQTQSYSASIKDRIGFLRANGSDIDFDEIVSALERLSALTLAIQPSMAFKLPGRNIGTSPWSTK